MDQFMAEIRKIPPVTRFLTASSLGISIPVLMAALSPYRILYVTSRVIKNFEIWRPYTSFFLGSPGISYVFEVVMLYRTASQLESGPYLLRSADLAWQLLFACASIILATRPLGSMIFGRPLLVCLAYLSSSLAPPGAQTSLMGLVTLPIQYFPYVMIGMDLLMGGPRAAAEAVAGAVVGHAWWWSVWGAALGSQGVLARAAQAPAWLRGIMGETHAPPPSGAAGAGPAAGVHVIPPQRQPPPTAGVTGHNWGSGQRLGR